ncbi:MAG: hypothetical protein QG562_579 [Patescibacteria group bacterium]|nr:hypothetical protein [Patescibacteria group bacterium]MDQ5958760.1 hypothetical protein [Patescibacteria group bacterium]
MAALAFFAIAIGTDGIRDYYKADQTIAEVSLLPADHTTIPIIEKANKQKDNSYYQYAPAIGGLFWFASKYKR